MRLFSIVKSIIGRRAWAFIKRRKTLEFLFGQVKYLSYRHKSTQKTAVVVIAKNESEYIQEWIAFHKCMGFDNIILYDNGSTDGMKDVISKWIDSGFVIYHHWPGNARQFPAYDDAINRYRWDYKYMAFIDCDEFLHPVDEGESILNILDKLFAHNRNAGGCAVNWCMYGSNGYETMQPGLVVERFTKRRNYTGFEEHIKTIVKPECVNVWRHAHYPVFNYGFWNIGEDNDRVRSCFRKIVDYKSLKINHYFTKSKEEWIKRRSLGRADIGSEFKRTIDLFYQYDCNEVQDLSACRYLDDVKRLMEEHK